jgi:imidazole glycerol-phosphate synthase subunit HisH
MKVVIVDYGIGNIGSIQNMLKRFDCNVKLTRDTTQILAADKIILPGVGAFDKGMKSLMDSGLLGTIRQTVLEKKAPILGICLGMQLLMDTSEEGELSGLGFIPGEVKKFDPMAAKKKGYKIPHMGWNNVHATNNSKLLNGLDDENRFYFVHSYYVSCRENQHIIGESSHGEVFNSVIQKENIYGVQFHPEKSHRFGLQLLKNFVEIC